MQAPLRHRFHPRAFPQATEANDIHTAEEPQPLEKGPELHLMLRTQRKVVPVQKIPLQQQSGCVQHVLICFPLMVTGICKGNNFTQRGYPSAQHTAWHAASAQCLLNEFSQDFQLRALLSSTCPSHCRILRVAEAAHMAEPEEQACSLRWMRRQQGTRLSARMTPELLRCLPLPRPRRDGASWPSDGKAV